MALLSLNYYNIKTVGSTRSYRLDRNFGVIPVFFSNKARLTLAFFCTSKSLLYQLYRYLDCRTGKDEIDCPDVTVACRLDQFRCAAGTKCLDASAKCDHKDDCGDNSDEAHCSEYLSMFYEFTIS